jgi:hypothetical protein
MSALTRESVASVRGESGIASMEYEVRVLV